MLIETIRSGWSTPRAAISANDTLVDASATTMKFANIIDGAYLPSPTQNAVEIAFSMGANGQSCAAFVYAARRNGDIVLVWNGTITAGTQVATDGSFYVDTLGTTTENWITTIKEVDGGGDNRMSRVIFDTAGYQYFFVQFTGISSESVQARYSGF